MRAVVFPGQGHDFAGMGLDQAGTTPDATALLERAGQIAGVHVQKILERGGPALQRQEVVQPLALAVGLGSVLGIRNVQITAGHSLGELAATIYAQALGTEEGLRFAHERGKIMRSTNPPAPGGIVAVRGTAAEVQHWLALLPDLAIAARNTEESWSLCGPMPELGRLSLLTPTKWVTREGAWHHPSQARVNDQVRPLLSALTFREPNIELLSAHSLHPVEATSLEALFLEQLSTPVQWFGVVNRLFQRGVREIVVAQPARHLAACIREILPSIAVSLA